MTSPEAKTLLPAFLDFVKTLQGDEKSEAQTFLDRLFKALGHAGAQEAGATFEYRVAKKPGSSQLSLFSGDDLASAPKLKGGVKFADLLKRICASWLDKPLGLPISAFGGLYDLCGGQHH